MFCFNLNPCLHYAWYLSSWHENNNTYFSFLVWKRNLAERFISVNHNIQVENILTEHFNFEFSDLHWMEGTTLVMLATLLLRVCLLSLNQDIHRREGTALVMLAKLLLWVCLLSLNQDIHWREGTTLVMLTKLPLWVYAYSLWIKIYIEGKVQHWSCWQNYLYEYMLTLFESRYTLKGRYNIDHVDKTTSSLWIKIYIERKVQHWSCWQKYIYKYAYSRN